MLVSSTSIFPGTGHATEQNVVNMLSEAVNFLPFLVLPHHHTIPISKYSANVREKQEVFEKGNILALFFYVVT